MNFDVISRRSLLRTSAIVAGTFGVIRGPGRLWAQGAGPYEVANCDVIAVRDGHIYCTDDSNPVTLPIDRKTNIWKGKDGFGLEAIKPGDHIDAQIEITPTGQRRVRNMWVNIANVTGTVLRLIPRTASNL
jgi:hypothetical protein